MMTTADVLCSARAMYEKNPSHAPADVYPLNGCCPITAITHVCMTSACDYTYRLGAEIVLQAAMGGGVPIPEWNAEHSTEDVLAAFDRAIAAAEATNA